MTEIVLIRHGQAAFGEADYDILTSTGEQQALVTGRHFAACNMHFSRVISGEMKRQQQTAGLTLSAMSNGHHLTIDPAFNEFDHMAVISAAHPHLQKSDPQLVADMEANFSNATFQPYFKKAVSLWMEGLAMSEGEEGFHLFCRRVVKGVSNLAASLEKGERAAIFTSGGPIAMALGLALNQEPTHAMDHSWTLKNGSFTTLYRSRSGLKMSEANVTAHLAAKSPELVTFR